MHHKYLICSIKLTKQNSGILESLTEQQQGQNSIPNQLYVGRESKFISNLRNSYFSIEKFTILEY